jgi:hypothetical protein
MSRLALVCLLVVLASSVRSEDEEDAELGLRAKREDTNWLKRHFKSLIANLGKEIRISATRVEATCKIRDLDEEGKVIRNKYLEHSCKVYREALKAIQNILRSIFKAYDFAHEKQLST